MRPTRALLALCVLLAACNSGGRDDRAGDRVFATSEGEVALTGGGSLRFSITSERYKQWDAAQRGLDRGIAARFGALLEPASPSERSIARAVELLESEPRARHAIERAGMSVRDFVVTTVALEQEMRLRGQGSTRQEPTPMPPPFPMPVDSAYLPDSFAPSHPVPPVAPRPTDTMPVVEPVFMLPPTQPAPLRDSMPPRRDSVPPWRDSTLPRRDPLAPTRDTFAPKRDTITPKPDTLLAPKPVLPRDTVRDTIPRDTLPRT